ncbi:hypothetical protein Tco_1146973 [Tanacetum coccineum]
MYSRKQAVKTREVHFLGHVVNHNGIHVDPGKIEAVKNWKAPTMPSEILGVMLGDVNRGLGSCTLCKEAKDSIKAVHPYIDRIELTMVRVGGGSSCYSDLDPPLTSVSIRYHRGKANEEAIETNNLWTKLIRPKSLLAAWEPEYDVAVNDLRDNMFAAKQPRYLNDNRIAITMGVKTLTTSAYFLAIREDYNMEKLARLYIDEITVLWAEIGEKGQFMCLEPEGVLGAMLKPTVPLDEIKVDKTFRFVKDCTSVKLGRQVNEVGV